MESPHSVSSTTASAPSPIGQSVGRLDRKVFIRDARGNYLALDDNGPFFTNDRAAAAVLDFQTDQVAAQIEMIRKANGPLLVAEPVPPEEVYEVCDRCHELFMASMIFFDGRGFLCGDCRKKLPAPKPANEARAAVRAEIGRHGSTTP